MFTNFVRQMIEKHLNHVVVPPSETEIDASFLSKRIFINQLLFHEGVFTYFSLPFELLSGQIKDVLVEWDTNNPYSMSMSIRVGTLGLTCSPYDISGHETPDLIQKDIFDFQKSKLRSKFSEIIKVMRIFENFINSKQNGDDEYQKNSMNSKLVQRIIDNIHFTVERVELCVQCPSKDPNRKIE